MNLTVLAGAILLGLLRPDPAYQTPTRAAPERHECLLTWQHPEQGWLVHSVAKVRRNVVRGREIDADAKVPWPCVLHRGADGEWYSETLSGVRCVRWTPLAELIRRARHEAKR